MAKRKRRSFGKFLSGAVKDVVMPTSMGLGLAIGGCGGSSGAQADGPLAVMPPTKDAAVEYRDGYAIMPPVKDAARADTRDPDVPVYAIMPLVKDAAPDLRDTRPDAAVYAIMPIRRDAAGDLATPDTEAGTRDSLPDTTKPPPKEAGVIYPIMALPILPPSA